VEIRYTESRSMNIILMETKLWVINETLKIIPKMKYETKKGIILRNILNQLRKIFGEIIKYKKVIPNIIKNPGKLIKTDIIKPKRIKRSFRNEFCF